MIELNIKVKYISFLAFLLLAGQLCAQQSFQRSELPAAVQLEALLQQTSSFSAGVQQLQTDQDGRALQETRARLLMQKPASFYWEIIEPYSELMVTDGSLIWRYEPDLEQVTIQRFNDDIDRTPVMLLNSNADSISASFEVSALLVEQDQLSKFILTPRNPGSLYEQLSLTFVGAELIEMHFENSLGQLTSLNFTQIVRNQALPAGQFSFTPPDGVEIIDSSGE